MQKESYEVRIRDRGWVKSGKFLRVTQESLVVRLHCQGKTKVIFRDPNAWDAGKLKFLIPGLNKFESRLFAYIYGELDDFSIRRDHKILIAIFIMDIVVSGQSRWDFGNNMEIVNRAIYIGRYSAELSAKNNPRQLNWTCC